jgi:hypothetical protein
MGIFVPLRRSGPTIFDRSALEVSAQASRPSPALGIDVALAAGDPLAAGADGVTITCAVETGTDAEAPTGVEDGLFPQAPNPTPEAITARSHIADFAAHRANPLRPRPDSCIRLLAVS